MKKHFSRIARALWRFLILRPWAVWVGICVPSIMLAFAARWPQGSGVSEDERIVIVAVLETSGLVLVAIGYAGLRSEFGRPGIAAAARAYLREFAAALRSPRTISLSGSVSEAIGLVASARATVTPGPDAPLLRRVEILEQELRSVTIELAELATMNTREHSDIRDQLAKVKHTTEEELREVRGLLESTAIGAPGVEVLGWIWLIAGVAVSSFPSVGALIRPAP